MFNTGQNSLQSPVQPRQGDSEVRSLQESVGILAADSLHLALTAERIKAMIFGPEPLASENRKDNAPKAGLIPSMLDYTAGIRLNVQTATRVLAEIEARLGA